MELASLDSRRTCVGLHDGLVVGLAGTGDSNKVKETVQSIGNMLKSFGVAIDTSSLKPDNVAAVMVTATLPPFVREGDAIDVTVSSIGDADSIQGGTLIQTPLRAGNGEVYAVAQGAVSTGGFVAGYWGEVLTVAAAMAPFFGPALTRCSRGSAVVM